MTHYPHPFVPKHKSEIHRQWKEIREAKCPIVGSKTSTYTYEGTFIEYTYINKKGKKVYVPEFCLLVKWL